MSPISQIFPKIDQGDDLIECDVKLNRTGSTQKVLNFNNEIEKLAYEARGGA